LKAAKRGNLPALWPIEQPAEPAGVAKSFKSERPQEQSLNSLKRRILNKSGAAKGSEAILD
jgi:hypothetical protein